MMIWVYLLTSLDGCGERRREGRRRGREWVWTTKGGMVKRNGRRRIKRGWSCDVLVFYKRRDKEYAFFFLPLAAEVELGRPVGQRGVVPFGDGLVIKAEDGAAHLPTFIDDTLGVVCVCARPTGLPFSSFLFSPSRPRSVTHKSRSFPFSSGRSVISRRFFFLF